MYLRSYVHAGTGDTDMLDPAVIAALAPIWAGRMPSEELVGIGTTGATTGALIIWPLADLNDTDAARRFLHPFLQTDCREVWLLAFTANPAALTGPLGRLDTAMTDTPYRHHDNTLAVTDYGRRWTLLADRREAPSDDAARPVAELDPVATRMWLLASRAGREQTRTLQSLRAHPDHETAAAAERARDSITRARSGIDAAVRATQDAEALHQALAEPDLPNLRQAIQLGLALAEDTSLLAAAMDSIWASRTAPEARVDLWRYIAHVSTSDAHATATALAAFAAWCTGDLAYATAALEHALGLYPGESPLIGWLCDLLAHGVPPTDLGAGSPMIPAHLHSGITRAGA